MKNEMILDIHERPKKKSLWFVLSLQHVFAMFGATILVPMLTGLPVSVALFSSGVGTLIYILCTKAKVPVYLGSSFAYLGVIASVSGFTNGVATNGYGAVMTGLLTVGLIYVLISVLIKIFGKTWINKVLPPVVIGPAIMIIGLSLAGSAISNFGLVGSFKDNWKLIVTGLVAAVTVIVIMIKGKGFLKIVPFLCGIVLGFITASILGLVDFDPLFDVIKTPSQWFKIPEFLFLGFFDKEVEIVNSTITFHKINFAAILTIAPLAFVTACEHIGDHSVLGKVCNRDFLKDPGLDRTILGDGLATTFAALIGGPANTTYGENTSVVGLTRVASVWVTGLAAVIAILLSFSNIVVALIQSIPASVMGGMSIILYGFIALNGMKMIIDSKINLSKTSNFLIVSIMLIIGIGGASLSIKEVTITSTTIAVIVGVVLNLILNRNKKNDKNER